MTVQSVLKGFQKSKVITTFWKVIKREGGIFISIAICTIELPPKII